MTRRELPEAWAKAMEPKRLRSLRDLARKLEVSPQTASRLVHGEQTSRDTIEAAAELLQISPERIRAMRNEEPLPPFRLPPEADQLGQQQRAAVVAVVRAMLEPRNAPAMKDRTGHPVPQTQDDIVADQALAREGRQED